MAILRGYRNGERLAEIICLPAPAVGPRPV